MPYPPDTQLWVRCDDGVWWPAKVREMDAEMRAFLSAEEDCCVEFYHSASELYPLVSSDASRVRPLHAEPHARTVAEAEWFANEEVQAAVKKALRDYQQRALMQPLPQPAAPSSRVAAGPPVSTPYSAAELRNIQALLDAVGSGTAAQLRQQLQQASVSVAVRDVRQQEKRERQSRKRQRVVAPTAPAADAIRQWRREVLTPPAVREAGRDSPSPPIADGSAVTGTTEPPPSPSPSPSSSSSSASAASSGSSDSAALPFVPAARRHVLEVLRHEVFDCPSRLVLSPLYQFVEVLGAVAVENRSLATTLPSPLALRQRPDGGFSPSRRVLLVPLTDDYDHTSGWMVPTELDGVPLSMAVSINDTPVALPHNWQLSPAKEAAAVKTAVSVDVTDVVLRGGRELFTLHVVFSGDVEEMEMWRGVIACVFVEEVGLAKLGERIVSTYRKPATAHVRRSQSSSRGDRGVVDITEASVKIQCPITTLTMEIPVRSAHCEHLQCMELAAVLIQCARQNVWNCPLCNAAMTPSDICVNYRLKDWLASHPQQLAAVEYVVETEPGTPLKVVYREKKARSSAAVEVVDEDD